MRFIPIKTRSFLPPQDDLPGLLKRYLPPLQEGDIVFVTSKILAIGQGRCVKITEVTDKHALVKKEADEYVPGTRLSVKNSILVSNAGIDASNGNGYYILWPRRIEKTLQEIWAELRREHSLKNLGVVATDTHSTPLRYGTVGTAIGSFGLEPLLDYRGKKDVFGRPLKYTKANLLDAITATAVLLMGESGESTPLLVLRDLSLARFTEKSAYRKIVVPRAKDKYAKLLRVFKPAK